MYLFVVGLWLDRSQERHQIRVACFLVVDRSAGHESESGALDEFLFASGPFKDFCVTGSTLAKEVVSAPIAEVPGVEVTRPSVDLSSVKVEGSSTTDARIHG